MTIHPQAAVSRVYSVGQNLHMPTSSVFGSSFIPHNWEVFAQYCFETAEYLQSSLDLGRVVQDKSALIELVKKTEYTNKCPHLLFLVIAGKINNGVFA